MISFISLLGVLSLISAAPLLEERAVDGISHVGILESGQDLVDQGMGRPCLQWSLNWDNYPKSECYYWSTLDNRDYDTRFWRFKKGWIGSDDQVAAMESLERGAVAALDVYSKFADVKNIKIRIVLTTDDLGPDTLAVTNPGVFQNTDPDWQWCAIRVQLPAASGNRDADLQQVVAHELYHCIAFAKPNSQQPGSPHAPSQWWLEGGPEFFADQVAPPGQSPTLPYGLIGEYRPASPLYKQDYAAAIIFQFLNNQGWSDQRIDEFLGQQHYLGDEAAMLNDLYVSELAPIFPDFAKALLDSEIYYTAPGPFKGRKVRPDYDSFFPHNTWSVASGTTAMLTAAAEPFGINRYTLRVGPKESIVLRFQAPSECQNRCVLNYRRQGTKSWAALTDTILANCEDREVYYDFLFTYTGRDVQAGAGGRQIQIQATKTDLRKRQETCEPQPAPSVDPNRCLIGKWQMDLEKTIPVLKERLEANMRASGTTAFVSGLSITGSATCDIDENFVNHWVYNQMQMSWLMSGSSIPPTNTILNIQGEMTGKIVFSEQNKVLTWKEQRTSVSAKSKVFTSVLPEPLEFDFPLFGNSGATVEVEYECAGDRMTMVGRMGGQYIYTWILKKVG